MHSPNPSKHDHDASIPARLLRRGVGLGAVAVLASAGVAAAAPQKQHATAATGGAALSAPAHAGARGAIAIDTDTIRLRNGSSPAFTIDAHAAGAKAPYSSVVATPKTLTPGQRITITGNGPKNAHAGEWISLESDAFVSKITTNGIPTIRTQVLVNGMYRATATIKPGLRSTTYAIMGTYKGQPLDTVAWIKVRPYSSVSARPRFANAGQRLQITGNAPKNAHAGEWITLKSYAFSSRFTSDGVPSIRAQVLVNGTYSATVPLRRSVTATTYTVRGSFKGQPLDTSARITVR